MSSEMVPFSVGLCRAGKRYEIYDDPRDRLRQVLWWNRRRRLCRPFWAVRDVTLHVGRGETLAIIGRNGSGKSTLLELIAGTLAPTEGEVSVRGSVGTLLELGSGFDPNFTGRENVSLNGALLGLDGNELRDRMAEIAAFADIGEFFDQPVRIYSSGMFVRLAFATAVVLDPDVLVIDEALSVGDIFFQQKCIRHLQKTLRDRTKILATHDLQLVSTIADRVIILDRGSVSFEGSPAAAIEEYMKLLHDAAMPPHALIPSSAERSGSIADDPPGWIEIPPGKTSGTRDVKILRAALTDHLDRPLRVVQPGERILVRMVVRAEVSKGPLIFGYLVCDRLGNEIFGQNTCSIPGAVIDRLERGHYRVTIAFDWPRVRPGEYTVTLGIGEGDRPLDHRIECWVHGIFSLSSVSPLLAIHGIFDNPLVDFGFQPIEAS